jgi:hypothetical protein
MARRVRTAAGAKRYGVPIGTVIGADGPRRAVGRAKVGGKAVGRARVRAVGRAQVKSYPTDRGGRVSREEAGRIMFGTKGKPTRKTIPKAKRKPATVRAPRRRGSASPFSYLPGTFS